MFASQNSHSSWIILDYYKCVCFIMMQKENIKWSTLNFYWMRFWPERIFLWYYSILTFSHWFESLLLFPVPQNQNLLLSLPFMNCWKHAVGCNKPADGSVIWRLPVLFPGVGKTTSSVSGFQGDYFERDKVHL